MFYRVKLSKYQCLHRKTLTNRMEWVTLAEIWLMSSTHLWFSITLYTTPTSQVIRLYPAYQILTRGRGSQLLVRIEEATLIGPYWIPLPPQWWKISQGWWTWLRASFWTDCMHLCMIRGIIRANSGTLLILGTQIASYRNPSRERKENNTD